MRQFNSSVPHIRKINMQINPKRGVAVLGGKPAEHKRKILITHTLWGSFICFLHHK